MLAVMRTILAQPRHLLWLVIAAILVVPSLSHAQTATTSPAKSADTVLLIFKAKQCTTACDSVLQVQWRYGGRVFSRTVQPRSTDTLRAMRVSFADSARPSYVAVKPVPMKPMAVAAYVAPVIVPPVVIAPPVGAPLDLPVGYIIPAAPATFAIPYPATTRTTRVPAGADLQAALNAAQPGDELVLADGAVFTGNYLLPRINAQWIVVRSETCKAPGVRADSMPGRAVIQTPNTDPAIRAGTAARYRLACLEVAHAATNASQDYGLIVLGRGDETSAALQPTDIVLDRVYVHGSTTAATRRCVAFNGARLAVIDSWLSECHEKGSDAQGVGGWSGTGPYLIQNNRIEASGQGVMFGGSNTLLTGVSPSDIIIRRNYFYKPLTWARGVWTVKATFELKHARRVLFEGNVLENQWTDAQVGFAILFQSINQSGGARWSTVRDVLVQNNRIINATGGFNVLSKGTENSTVVDSVTARILVRNNLFENVGRDPISGDGGSQVQLLASVEDVTFTANTFTLAGSSQKAVSLDGAPSVRTTITDNVFANSAYQVHGSGEAPGLTSLARFMPSGLFTNNTVPGSSGTLGTARGAGANLTQVNAAIAGVVR